MGTYQLYKAPMVNPRFRTKGKSKSQFIIMYSFPLFHKFDQNSETKSLFVTFQVFKKFPNNGKIRNLSRVHNILSFHLISVLL